MLTPVGHAGASLPGELAAILVQLCFDLQAQGHLILPLLAPLRSLAAQWPGLLQPLAGCLGLLLQSSGMSCLLLQLAIRDCPRAPRFLQCRPTGARGSAVSALHSCQDRGACMACFRWAYPQPQAASLVMHVDMTVTDLPCRHAAPSCT